METVTRGEVTDNLEPSRDAWSTVDWLIVGALCGVAVLLPALVAIGVGSFSLPQNDDWSYRRTAEHFAQTGHLAFNGWTSMTLVGEILWSWPFLRILGNHGWVFGLSTAVLAVVGVACAYYVGRQLLARGWAAAAVLLVVAIPGFASSTSTFMTDAPAFASEMACLALGLAAIRRSGRSRLALVGAAVVVGVFAFSIREFALAAPVAVLLAVGRGERPTRRYGYLTAGVLLVGLCAIIYKWSTHVPGYLSEPLSRPDRQTIASTVQAYFTLALFLSPAVAVAAWRRLRLRPSIEMVGVVLALAVGVLIDHVDHGLFIGNYLAQQGSAGAEILPGGRPTLLPGPLWQLLTVIALASGAVLVGIVLTFDRRLVRHWRSWRWSTPSGLLWLFSALVCVGLSAYALISYSFFDRYLWASAFAVGVLLLRRYEPPTRREAPLSCVGIAVALSGLLVLVTAALTLDADAYSAARWHAGQVIVSHGVPAYEIDAGFEWVGAHATGIADTSIRAPFPPYESWYARMEPGFRDCGIVSGSPLSSPSLRLLQNTSYDLVGFGVRRKLYMYITSAPGC